MTTPRIYEVTELRQQILEALDKYVFASRPQLYRIIPKRGDGKQETWERALRRALDLMERAGQITHGPIYEDGAGSQRHIIRRWVHYLTRRGAEALAGSRADSKVPYYQRKPVSLLHEEAISGFHLQLEEALKKFSALKLHWFQKDIKKGTSPDAIFGIEDTTKPRDKSTHWFFLEMEMSRAGNWKGAYDQKVRKAKHYYQYRNSRELTKDWSYIVDCRVIFHETTTERMHNLLHKFGKLLPCRFLWVTSKEEINAKGILDKVFYTPKDWKERSQSILDLTQ
jgi:hypothetical protein